MLGRLLRGDRWESQLKSHIFKFCTIELRIFFRNMKLLPKSKFYVKFGTIPSISYLLKTKENTFRLLLCLHLSSVTEPILLYLENFHQKFMEEEFITMSKLVYFIICMVTLAVSLHFCIICVQSNKQSAS